MAKRIPKIGEVYAPINRVIAIPGKQNRFGIVTRVEEFPDCVLIEADYGVERGNPCHIFLDIIYKETNIKELDMNTSNPIQFLDFPTRAKRESVKFNEGVIYKRKNLNKGMGTHQLRLPPLCMDALEAGFHYIRIAVNNLTNEVFFVFDKTDGMHVSMKKGDKNNNRIVNKPFVSWLEERFNLPEYGGGVVVFSDNLNRENGYTFKVEPKRD